MTMRIRINEASCKYEKEELKSSFGFKGSALTSLWQTVVCFKSEKQIAIGLGVQSVLWSDAEVFRKYGEENGNQKMFELTQYATELCRTIEFESPIELFEQLFPNVYSYAKKIVSHKNLRTTFVLNALVPVDFAAWQLWAKENGKQSFDDICRLDERKHAFLSNIPLITYSTSVNDVIAMAQNGTSVFKIKIGSDPKKNNDLDAMLSWDKKRILEIHQAVKNIRTPHTVSGNILYYLDANGRYDTKERLKELLVFAKENEILERIVLLEEPFDEYNKIDVSDLPVCIAADESAHSLEDVKERFKLGYKALTLKPIAKTLSLTIKMAEYAREKNMICFCADLTVNPIMVSWNQNVAARLNVIPGMNIGVLESNGEHNYKNWERMHSYHPKKDEQFTKCLNGLFILDNEFYETNGGIFEIANHFEYLFQREAKNYE